ncbi:hypothetical protein niasHT_032142 [Heterodera trifolii]|uniref:Uncharacterized protein n=1 Tax=Heterodera trifolii TaxID=157864 RepID=A0ABD2HUT2_9BILA
MRAALEMVVNSTHLPLTEFAARHNIDYRKNAGTKKRDDAQPTRETEHHYSDYESEILGYFKRRQALFRPDNYPSRLNMGSAMRRFMTKTTQAMTKIKAHKLSAVAIYSETSMFSLQLCQLKIENSRLHMPNGSNYETKGGAQFCRNLSHPYGLWFYRA